MRLHLALVAAVFVALVAGFALPCVAAPSAGQAFAAHHAGHGAPPADDAAAAVPPGTTCSAACIAVPAGPVDSAPSTRVVLVRWIPATPTPSGLAAPPEDPPPR